MTDKFQTFRCIYCHAELDESRQTIVWDEDDSPVCEYCADEKDGVSLSILDILKGIDDALRLIEQAKVAVVMGADDPWQRLQRIKKYLNNHYTALAKMYFDGKAPAMVCGVNYAHGMGGDHYCTRTPNHAGPCREDVRQ